MLWIPAFVSASLSVPIHNPSSDPTPREERVDSFVERSTVAQHSAVDRFEVSLRIEHAGAAEATDVREFIEVVERNLEGLTPSPRLARHCPAIPVPCPGTWTSYSARALRKTVFKSAFLCSRDTKTRMPGNGSSRHPLKCPKEEGQT